MLPPFQSLLMHAAKSMSGQPSLQHEDHTLHFSAGAHACCKTQSLESHQCFIFLPLLMQAAKPSTRKAISPAQARRNAERLVSWHESLIFLLYVITIGVEFFVPVCFVYYDKAVPVIPGFILIMVASIVFLKLVAYAHSNCDLR